MIVTITGANAQVITATDNTDGTYSASYTPTLVGSGIDSYAITLNGGQIGGGPYERNLIPAAANAAAPSASIRRATCRRAH